MLQECEPGTIREITNTYNALAAKAQRPLVRKFEDKPAARRRLARLVHSLENPDAPAVPRKPARRINRMRFNYPPKPEQLAMRPGSLRVRCFELLRRPFGATFAEVEALCAAFDEERGREPWNLASRAYGLIRLLHVRIGYALREEGEGAAKRIFLMTPEEWAERQARKAARKW